MDKATRSNKQNIQVGHYDPLNVDIVYSIFGVSDPPELPLRQELLSQGVEIVHNAKGVGQKAVCKEQRKREKRLLRKIKRLERKLEKKRSKKGTSQKREKALAMVRELRISIEHCARTISYDTYLKELRRVNEAHASRLDVDNNNSHDKIDPANDCTNHDGSINTHVVENRLMQALEMWNENEMQLSDEESLVYTDDDSVDSVLSGETSLTDEITEISSATHLHQQLRKTADLEKIPCTSRETDENESKSNVELREISVEHNTDTSESDASEGETVSAVWAKVNIDVKAAVSSKTRQNLSPALLSSSRKPLLFKRLSDDSLPTIVKSSSSSSVRFKDVKPTMEDNIARARALVQNAKVMKKSFNYEFTPSEPYSLSRIQSDQGNTHFNGSHGRYHLFVCRACPWSHRTLVVRAMKGLEKIIGVSYLECSWRPRVNSDIATMLNPDSDVSFWSIEDDSGDEHDDVFQAFKEIYLNQINKCTTVPILWDNRTKTVVGKTSTEIMWMLNFDFNKWAKQPKINLFPSSKKLEHDEVNRWLHRSLFAGVYRCGLATNQRQYDEAIQDLTDALDRSEDIVSKNGFLVGGEMTASDVRMFVVLIRFDEIYRVLFKTNTRRVSSMPGLMEYVKDIYNVEGMKDTCEFISMKRQYFEANSHGRKTIIPRGGTFIKLLENLKE